jgi:hypothetical protein
LSFIPSRRHLPLTRRYEPLTRQDFRISVLDVIYTSTGEKTVDNVHAHRVSLLFIVCANGASFHDDPRVVSTAKTYQALARAAFSTDSIRIDATCASAQTLFLIVRFIYNADRDKNEERWLITGLNSRLATMVRPQYLSHVMSQSSHSFCIVRLVSVCDFNIKSQLGTGVLTYPVRRKRQRQLEPSS